MTWLLSLQVKAGDGRREDCQLGAGEPPACEGVQETAQGMHSVAVALAATAADSISRMASSVKLLCVQMDCNHSERFVWACSCCCCVVVVVLLLLLLWACSWATIQLFVACGTASGRRAWCMISCE